MRKGDDVIVVFTAKCECGHILDQHDELTDACSVCLWCDYFKPAEPAVSVNPRADSNENHAKVVDDA